jgi:hypothetical protein
MRRFVYMQQYVRPEATRVSDGVVVRLRHEHFADETLVAGQESELDLGPGQPSGEAYPAAPGVRVRHPEPILPY